MANVGCEPGLRRYKCCNDILKAHLVHPFSNRSYFTGSERVEWGKPPGGAAAETLVRQQGGGGLTTISQKALAAPCSSMMFLLGSDWYVASVARSE